MATIHLQLVTPERALLDEAVDFVVCPTTEGQIEILANHEPLVAILQAGELLTHFGDRTISLAIAGGFVEVRPGNNVVVLADSAEHAAEIDPLEAQKALERATADMKQYKPTDSAYVAARAVYQHHTVRLNLARKHNRNSGPTSSDAIFKE
jgi:F-type H+-transporting ATPase subunit epsilon